MIFELAKQSDKPAIDRINKQVLDLHICWRPDIFCRSEEGLPDDFFSDCLEKQDLYVARNNGEVIGFVILFTWQTNGVGSVPSKVLDIDGIAIDEKFRHQGVGTWMMEELRRVARDRDCNDIQLSVYPQNENAVRFYEKIGFKVRNIRYQMYV